ncbi:MAG: hypothetical protein LAT64_05395 [Phycisphaerales bacterium]|nr:hypothetical protein [Planctomycetota bacterium]MCH8508190.1 hypothetical protein [Phycisphaerales bacterium]
MRIPCLLVAAAAGAAFAGSVPTEWTFELQCRSSLNPSIPSFNLPGLSSLSSQYVTIDADGTVAIRAFINAPGITEGIFVGQGGQGGLVLTADSEDPFWTTQLSLRNGLMGVGDGGFNNGASVYETDGTLFQRYNIGGPQGTSGYGTVHVTSDGAICYRGDFGFIGRKIVVDEFIDGVRHQRLVADSFSGAYSFLFGPRVNDARQVAANTIPETGPSRRIVRWEADNTPTTVAETGGAFNSFVNSVGFSQDGRVAFSARRSADSVWQVNRWDEGQVTVIAEGSNPDINNSSLANFPPVVSSNGWVAFRATDTANNSTALWVGDGENLVKLVEFGQIIDTDLGPLPLGFDFGGGTGRQVMNGVIDINDAGQVAFAAFLQNGTVGVWVATPATDPGCPADLTGDGQVNFFDLAMYLDLFNAGDPAADLAPPFGVLNFFDVAAYLDLYNQGCP